MSWRQSSNSYLSPEHFRQTRPFRTRSASASFTDTMSNDMRRHPSQSSHITQSSQTGSSIHSNIGESIAPFAFPNTSYIQRESDAFLWSRPQPQIQVQDHDTFTTVDHPLLPPDIPLPRPTPDGNDPLQNIEAGINDPSGLFEFVIHKLRLEYATHPNQTTYALSLAQIHLGTNAIRNFIAPRIVSPRSPQPPATPSAISPIHRANSTRQQYLCKLCPSPVRITSRGAFKRHVNEKHQPKSMFLCMHCDWTGSRKDKLRDHLKTKHDSEYDREQDLTERELALDEPSKCILCETDKWMNHTPPYTSWDEWFAGIVTHCHLEDISEDDPKKEPDSPPNQGGGNAGGNSGFLFQNLALNPGSSAGNAYHFQGSNVASDSMFTGWAFNRLATDEREDDESRTGKQISSKTSLETKRSNSGDISKKLRELSLDGDPPRSKSPSSQVDSNKSAEEWVPREMMLISEIIQELMIATLVFSINKTFFRLTGKLHSSNSANHAKAAVGPPILGEKTLYRIPVDHSISQRILVHRLRRCHNSLNEFQRELSTASTIPTVAETKKQQCDRRKRLSSLWSRLRAVSFVLSLRKEIAVDEDHSLSLPPPNRSQLASFKYGCPKAKKSSFTSEALESLYCLARKYLTIDFGDDTYMDDKNHALKSYSMPPCVNSPFGIFQFLQSLTAVISNPQPSPMESYDTTDFYGLLHRPMTNISTSF